MRCRVGRQYRRLEPGQPRRLGTQRRRGAHQLSYGFDGVGSSILLADDDPGYENARGKMTLEVDPSGVDTYTGVTFWACKMG